MRVAVRSALDRRRRFGADLSRDDDDDSRNAIRETIQS
jgi:hypothetical protein